MRLKPWASLACLPFFHHDFVRGQQSQATFTPAWIPLAVRSPYLNAWIRNNDNATRAWPIFGALDTESKILGWSGLVKVDGAVYSFLGNVPNTNVSTVTSSRLTPTRTIITANAGDTVQLTVTFLSPIEPDDLVLQSMPFSYMAVKVASRDGNAHEVSIYSDISGEWLSADTSVQISWETVRKTKTIYQRVSRQDPTPLSEEDGFAKDSVLYFGMAGQSPSMSWRTGDADTVTRPQFAKDPHLENSESTNPRKISESGTDWPVFAIAYDMGAITDETGEVVWALGLARDKIVQFAAKPDSGTTDRYPYYFSHYNTTDDAFQDFIQGYTSASARADDIDQRFMEAAKNKTSIYADLVALGTRQVMAAFEVTISQGKDGYNTSDVLAFMKGSGKMNAVQTIYAAWPALLYVNASWPGLLLGPSMQYGTSEAHTSAAAPSNLGDYPNATGEFPVNDRLGIEASASMLILAYSHAATSGDGALISEHYDTLKGWADYLVTKALYPDDNQETAEGDPAPNSTNLALKGILGLQAMSSISQSLDRSDDASTYAANASSMIDQWVPLAAADDHLNLVYGDASTSGLLYNVYAGKLLKTDLIPDNIYQLQTKFYNNQSTEASSYGLPYQITDGDNNKGRADLMLLTAAAMTDTNTRDAILQGVWNRATNNSLDGCFPNTYKISDGSSDAGSASPSMGALFALLAVDLPANTIVVPPTVNGDHSAHKSHTGAIIGGVIGGILAVALVGYGTAVCIRHRRQARMYAAGGPLSLSQSSEHTAEPWRPTEPNHNRPTKLDNLGPWTTSIDGTSERRSSGTGAGPSSTNPSTDMGRFGEGSLFLRNELENIRQEMEQIRAQREHDLPPPDYSHVASP